MQAETAPLRIAFGRVMQETNSFSSVATTRLDFERNHLLAGEALLAACQPGAWEVEGFLKQLELSGFMQAVQASKVPIEPIPLLSAWAISGGPLEQDFFLALCDELCQRLRAAGRHLDGADRRRSPPAARRPGCSRRHVAPLLSLWRRQCRVANCGNRRRLARNEACRWHGPAGGKGQLSARFFR